MRTKFLGFIAAGCLCALSASAATLFNTTELVATSAALEQTQSPPIAFTITTAGTYEFAIADAEFPAPVSGIRGIVVQDGVIVAQLDVAGGGDASDTFAAQPGDYRIHVLGTPGAGAATGLYEVSIAPAAGGAALVSTTGTVAATTTPGSTTFSELIPISVATTGTHELSIQDLQLPTTLGTITASVLYDNGSQVVLPPTSAFPATFDATASGEYVVVLVAQRNTASDAGLVSVSIEGPSAATVHTSVHPVGQVPAPLAVNFAVAGQYTLIAADAQFPQSLTGFRTLLVQGGNVLINQDGATPGATFEAAAGAAQLYTQVNPTPSVGVGAVRIRVAGATGNIVYAGVQMGDADPAPATPTIYGLTAPALAAGSYRVRLEDFGIPSNFTSLRLAATQGDAVLDDWLGEGQYTFDTNAGDVRFLIAATPASTTSGGLFGLQLEPQAGGASIIETNQGVGGLFRGDTLDIPTAGNYDITLTDLKFPAELRSAVLVITRGTSSFGQVFGGGQVRQHLEPGTYRLNFLGAPDASQSFGAYALKVADSPPVPTLNFSATPASVTTGAAATLQWSAANATACTAAGAWSGDREVSGTATTGTLNAPATYELTCNGPGGSISASVTVQVTAPRKGGGGGGMDPAVLFIIAGMLSLTAGRNRGSWQRRTR